MKSKGFIVLAIVTIISIIAVVRWFVFSRYGFSMTNDILFIFFVAPLILLIIFAHANQIRFGFKLKKTTGKVGTPILCVLMILFSLIVFISTTLPPPAITGLDTLRLTSDGRFSYRIDLNAGQDTATATLFIRDLNDRKVMNIPLDWADGIHRSGRGGNRSERILWGRLEKHEDLGQYILRIPPAVREFSSIYIHGTEFRSMNLAPVFEGIFLINLEAETSELLYNMKSHRTGVVQVHDETGAFSYQYSIHLTDIYRDGHRIRTEVYLNIHIGPSSSYLVSISIDTELMENDDFRIPSLFYALVWLSLEQTDTPYQFIARTTENFSEDITLTFLIDIQTLTVKHGDGDYCFTASNLQ